MSAADASRVLRARALLPPAAAPAADRGLPAGAREALAARLHRWQSFRDVVSAPGVDWSVPGVRASARPRLPRPERTIRDLRAGLPATTLATPPETLRVAFIRIDFRNDRGNEASSGNGRFDLSGPDTTLVPIDRAPHNRSFYLAHGEALKRYYDAQTYGRRIVEAEVWPRSENGAYTVSDMADFGPWAFSRDIYGAALHMFRTFLLAADSQSVALGDRIPWDRVTDVVLIHAGSDLQSDVRQDSKEDIPSFTIGVVDSDAVVVRDVVTPGDSVVVSRATVIPETINQDGYFGAINGVLAHECGHLFFGFADLYDVETGIPVVGYWSLMDSGNLVGAVVQTQSGEEIFATGLLPPSVDPFHRFFATDALTFQEVDWGQTMPLQNSERHPDMRIARLSSDEDLLIENRWIAPDSVLEFDQDPVTRVVLGPKNPDRYEYDALLPGPGILVWHVDNSVIPFTNSLRVNPDFAFNSNPLRRGIKVIEADALADLGDLNSPYLLGSYRDPWYHSNNPSLSDTTRPKLVTNQGTRPHMRFDFPAEPDTTMPFAATRTWQLAGWPVLSSFPESGPMLLAVDADGDRNLEVCWAGGDPLAGDSTSLFAVRVDGQGLFGTSHVFATLDARPRPEMAAIAIGDPLLEAGPAWFAVSTYPTGPDLSSAGGRVWLVDSEGQPAGAWPANLPSLVTTPPVIAGEYPNANVFVGCEDGRLYALRLDGTLRAVSAGALAGGVRGRLAVTHAPGVPGTDGDALSGWSVAAGGAQGDVMVSLLAVPGAGPDAMTTAPGWPLRIAAAPFAPDFLWLDFDGVGVAGGAASDITGCGIGRSELVVHQADRLWAFCLGGRALPGWDHRQPDTLLGALGAGDPDRDGYPEVLTQSQGAQVAFINVTGSPSPGWPRAVTREGILSERFELTDPDSARRFPTVSPPLAIDPVGDGRTRVVALNASGMLVALDAQGKMPVGWPLATGAGAAGAPLAADLDRDGRLELVAPDRGAFLYAYALPAPANVSAVNGWTMLGGDPGRSASLPAARTPVALRATRGPLVPGTLIAYPNPARRRPVTFAFRLTEPADVEVRILDTSGHEVASFHRDGRPSDNLFVWDPGAVPAGLYLASVRFRSPGADRTEVVPVGLLR